MTANNNARHAPYSRPNPVLDIIRRNREKGLPEPIIAANLERIGISANTAYAALQALRFLGLVTGDGQRSEIFEKMRRVSDDEYRTLLANVIQQAYQSVFEVVDPAKDDRTAIQDAFRVYEPAPMWDRMVVLFMELCREAHIVPQDEAAPKRPTTPRRTSTARRPAQGKTSNSVEAKKRAAAEIGPKLNLGQADYVVLAAMFQKLPQNGKWTEADRKRWLDAFTVTLDFSVEVVADQEDK